MIPHAFYIFCNKMKMHTGCNVARIFHHKCQKLSKQRVINLIDSFIALNYRQRQCLVLLNIGIQGVTQHQLYLTCHAAQGRR